MDATRRSGLGRSSSIRVGSAPVSLDHMCVFVSRYCCGVSTTVICLEGFNGRGCRQMDRCWRDVDQHFNRVYIQNCSLQLDRGETVAPACVERFSTETEMKSTGLLLWIFPLIIPFNLAICFSCLFHMTKFFFRESVVLLKTAKICQSQSKTFEYQSTNQSTNQSINKSINQSTFICLTSA